TLKELISQTMVRWSQEDQIQDPELVRIMYSLLRRQYDSIGELLQALRKAYTISAASVKDTINLLAALGQIRSLLSVRMGKEEELLMINGLGYGINRILFLMVPLFLCLFGHIAHVILLNACTLNLPVPLQFYKVYTYQFWFFCCISRQVTVNSKIIISLLIYSLAEGKSLCSIRESCCDSGTGCGTVCDQHMVVTYLAGCGLQSCPVLLAKGYPDIGWNPIEGERYLSFLRFAVFANSESVEENASVVVKLLIR
ncbi:RYR3 protein, partial [Orthonyx spaldingii]|nr:RYR3 protein [Orthonyx spaldingii]